MHSTFYLMAVEIDDDHNNDDSIVILHLERVEYKLVGCTVIVPSIRGNEVARKSIPTIGCSSNVVRVHRRRGELLSFTGQKLLHYYATP
ncbi:hypothetical protein Trydic_g14950 [Trypoxylus dichotomus]